MTRKLEFALLAFAASLPMGFGGCSQSEAQPRQASQPKPSASDTGVSIASETGTTSSDQEHGHKPGEHGGIIVSLGRDSYHVEAVFEKGNTLRLYTLGNDESRVIDVDKQTLRGFVKAEGESEAQSFTFEPEPQEGDAAGRTSQFVATLPEDLDGANLEVTVPNIVISGERFRLGFKSTPEQHDEGMPDKVVDAEEQKLYLTPGGKYTEEDIKVNGNVTASVKFKGFMSSHDMKPKPGDKICPVTMTKANPKCTWIVGGKAYEFCCPPCVDEFVKLAKETPEEIKEPGEYVKR
ncbi:MAG: hypothetical protein WD648_04005 [Planctomycetaceae bacterium]